MTEARLCYGLTIVKTRVFISVEQEDLYKKCGLGYC
jgi:hypothetical protein